MVNIVCVLSAISFFVSNVLGIVFVSLNLKHQSNNDFDELYDLDSNYLQDRWDHRFANERLHRASSIINTFAWFLFAIPMIEISWALSRGGKRLVGVHAAIAGFALAGSITELISRLMSIGIYGASRWVSSSFNLDQWLPDSENDGSNDGVGWKVLEVAFILVEGVSLWIDAFEWLALAFILILLYYSVGTQSDDQRAMPMWWARLGLASALLSIIDLTADILRIEEWMLFTRISMLFTVLNTLIILPVWLLILGFRMNTTLPKYNEELDRFMPGEPMS
mmetsp:Transcript_23917/g.55809  ORF Transcript_23917/g.55809 Transcript_23917/m.55809 type:complete len:279 (+) Transcript_23917:80-916(+)